MAPQSLEPRMNSKRGGKLGACQDTCGIDLVLSLNKMTMDSMQNGDKEITTTKGRDEKR